MLSRLVRQRCFDLDSDVDDRERRGVRCHLPWDRQRQRTNEACRVVLVGVRDGCESRVCKVAADMKSRMRPMRHFEWGKSNLKVELEWKIVSCGKNGWDSIT